MLQVCKFCKYETIVGKGVLAPPPPLPIISKSSPPLLGSPPFLQITHPSTLLANRSSHNNRNATMKFSSINTIYVKQKHNVGFFIFRFTLKYMLGNVYINKIHAKQCLYISLYCILQGRFFPSFQFLCCIQKNLSNIISKQLGRKYFSMEQLPIDFC